jgi:small subunit ribosomal protein S16
MAVRLRLRRVGARKDPVWRVVVADQRSPRDGRVIETLGHYNPQTTPSTVSVNQERASYWLERGAQATPAVRRLLRIGSSAPAGTGGAEPAPPAAGAAGQVDAAGDGGDAPEAAHAAPRPAAEEAGGEAAVAVADAAPSGESEEGAR